jgi:Zn-dependent M28 family amino/carboxypeptidase
VGADDNGGAVAVQLETARYLASLANNQNLDLSVKFVSFALEEPPFFDTPYMGSRVYAGKARDTGEKIDGMICLEMVGYTCHEPGCQSYPFPLMFFNYPKTGNFIGIVGNLSSRDLTRSLFSAFERNPRLPVIKLTVPLGGWLMPSIRLSDHSAFWDYGFKAVMITDSAFYRNRHYHRPSDTMEKLDYRFMAELVQSLALFFCGRQPPGKAPPPVIATKRAWKKQNIANPLNIVRDGEERIDYLHRRGCAMLVVPPRRDVRLKKDVLPGRDGKDMICSLWKHG